MDRHTKLLKEFSRSKTQAELLNKLSKSRKAVDTGKSGTFGVKFIRIQEIIDYFRK